MRSLNDMFRLRRDHAVGLVVVAALGIGYVVYSEQSTTTATGSSNGASMVRFEVWGNAPQGVNITYGSDGTNLDGRLPLDETMTIDENASYYDVSAQLNGGGDIRCAITIGDDVRDGHARGGYNICSAQLNRSYDGSWH